MKENRLLMENANIKTNIPGNRSQELVERRKRVVPKGVSNDLPSFVEKAEGALITDVDGNTFIDFVGAIGVMNVGHNHPKVTKAIHEQVDQFIHTGFNVMMYESYIELAEKLADIAPGNHEKKVLLQNSGAEAVENAVKIARKFTKRQGIISFTRGFHGRTLMTMTMTSKVKPYKFEFGPFAPEVYKAPYPYVYRRPVGMTEEEYVDHVISNFKNFFITDVAPEHIAAVVMEPIQGEGGFIIPHKRFVQEIAKFCKENGILFIADEIQTGFARTGRFFAIEHFDVIPDMLTVSKSLGAGVPISGVIGCKEIMDEAEPGELGGTYSGSPLGCKAALAVLEIIEEENLIARSEKIGIMVMEKLRDFQKRFDCIGDVRGIGAMCAMEIVSDKQTKKPSKQITRQIIHEANKRGLLLFSAGIYGNVIRFLMPLTITDDQLNEGLHIIEQSLEVVTRK